MYYSTCLVGKHSLPSLILASRTLHGTVTIVALVCVISHGPADDAEPWEMLFTFVLVEQQRDFEQVTSLVPVYSETWGRQS